MPARNRGLHDRLIDVACRNGWNRRGWKKAVRQLLGRPPWGGDESGEVIEFVDEVSCRPDAWRIKIEGEGEGSGWSYDVCVIELLEVEVTHPIDLEKLEMYEQLWWRLDGTSRFHLRVFRMDRYGFVVPFMTEGITIGHLARHAPGGHEPIWYHEVPYLADDEG
jgi:hypothetical protein